MSALTAAARIIEVTDTSGWTHLVTEEQFAAGRRSGRYVALCDDLVLSASLTVEDHKQCRRCAQGHS